MIERRQTLALEPQSQRLALGALLIVVITVAVYWPALHGEFLVDDDKLITDNSLVRSSVGLLRIWASTQAMDYWPLTNTNFWLEWRLWGSNPTGYHITNLLLHIAAAFLIWAILRKLALPGAFLAALLFAVHPVNVESVAWISQRKNTLAMFFFLLSILWWLRATERRTRRWYWLSLLAFTLAMLSKGSVAVLPVVLLLIVWWQKRRVDKSDLLRTAPFFLVAIVLTAVNVWFQKHGLDVVVRDVNFGQRLAGAGAVVWFYLAKALLPIDLVFVYPQWQIDIGQLLWWIPLVAALLVTVLLVLRKNPARPLLFAWLPFCVALLPVLGFTDVGFMQYSLVADHYQHIAIIAVVALVAAAWCAWQKTDGQVAIITAVALVGALAYLTFQQSKLYRDSITLCEATLAANPNSSIMHNNLGHDLQALGINAEARKHYEAALRIKPDYPDALNNLGIILAAEGRLSEAIELYQHALRVRPDHVNSHNSLGNAYSDLGRLDEAVQEYELALRLRPDYAVGHYNLGNALVRLGRLPEAIQHFQLATSYNPQLIQAYLNLADACSKTNDSTAAIAAAQTALQLARSEGNTALVQKIEAWLAAYHINQSPAP